VDEAENEFTDAIVPTAELVIPWSSSYRGRREDRAETDTKMAETDMHIAWHNLKADTKDSKLRKAVRKACKKVERAHHFFERYVQEMKEQLRRGDQRCFLQRRQSMEV